MIRILICDDQELVRAGLRMLLEAQDDLDVVGEALDGREAVRATAEIRPDVVLMDVRMPVMDGYVRSPLPGTRPAPLAALTERELEVLQLIGQGSSNAEIAARLFVGEATVKTHVNRLFAKLGVRDRAPSTAWCGRAVEPTGRRSGSASSRDLLDARFSFGLRPSPGPIPWARVAALDIPATSSTGRALRLAGWEVWTTVDADAQGCTPTPPAEIAAAFVEHAADPDGPDAEHLRRCPDCAAAVRELRAGAELEPELERRLLQDFRDWRDGA